jgi:hypothetical protein
MGLLFREGNEVLRYLQNLSEKQADVYFATCFSLISSKVLQSMQSVAVGRASRRFKPISTPQLSQ